MINRENWNDEDLTTCDVCGSDVPHALSDCCVKGMCAMCYVEYVKMQHMSVEEWEV